jgi:hypothetical protein
MSLKNLAKNVIALDEKEIFVEVFNDPINQEFVIALNTERGGFGVTSQLFDQGIDSNGNSLGQYALSTIAIKQKQGLPTDRITLFDTGAFYDSFRVRVGNGEFTITADPVKEDGNLFDDFGEDIVGLTEESRNELVKFITPEVQRIVLERICR